MTEVIRVGLLDDHRAFGESISMALSGFDDIECIGVVDTVEGLAALAADNAADVLLIDYQLANGTGIDAVALLEDSGARLIMLTAHASADVTERALTLGFERVLSKESALQEIVGAVRMPPLQAAKPIPTSDVRFSRRQREVLELMGQGLDPASIADELYISVHTARSHVKDVLRALGASTQLSAVTKAIREGYLLPPSRSTSN
jgi:DNA-binding NarL/FixJ family response regulator